MNPQYRRMFEPFSVNGLELKNRIVMPAMGTNLASSYGETTDAMISYYTRRAMGGTGLIVVENANVDFPLGSNGATQLRVDRDAFIPGLYRLTESIKKYGAKTCLQINHAGASTAGSKTKNNTPVAPSDVPAKEGGEIPRPLSREEIFKIAEKYAEAARRAQKAGFDAVEVHAGHSYLISQFMSPFTNHREDEFGGTLEKRSEFARLVLQRVREKLGSSFPVFIRISGDEFLEEGRNLEGTIKQLEYLVKFVDAINVTAGTGYNFAKQLEPISYPEGWRVYLSEEIKKYFNVPTVAVGNIRNPAYLESVLEEGKADLVAMGRGLISEPFWVHKVENGREDLLRRCISCNIGCVAHRVFQDLPIRCSLNPDVTGEREPSRLNFPAVPGELRPLGGKQDAEKDSAAGVVVIGAGPGGVEAACTAAELGYQTFLLEREQEIGGVLRYIRNLPSKEKMNYFVEYMQARVEQYPNLYLFTGVEPGPEYIERLKPGFIVNATGADPMLPPIPGLHEAVERENGPSLYSALDFLDKLRELPKVDGKSAIVAGGGAVGLECAEHLAAEGASVSVIEMLPGVAADMEIVTREDIFNSLEKYGVEIHTHTRIEKFEDGRVTAQKETGSGQQPVEFSYDLGVIALGMKSRAALYQQLQEHFSPRGVPVVNIGDSRRPAKVIDAVSQGREQILQFAEGLI